MYCWQVATAQTLQNFLTKRLHIAGAVLQRLQSKGCVRVNGRDAALAAMLHPGDDVQLTLPGWALPALDVIYEDDSYLVLNKPPRRAVCGDDSLTLEDLARAHGHTSARACHRLDAGTGGIVLFAKDEHARQAALGLFAGGQLEKTYECLVCGTPENSAGELLHYLTKDSARGYVRAYKQPRPGAVPARASYQVLAVRPALSLLRVQLHTGRTHQIRVQIATLGTPILGDDKYGDRAANRAYHCRLPCLWAVRLAFPDGLTGVLAGLSGKAFESRPVWPARCAELFME
ncbi:MAG: RluA family pseudouridine synthase [Eubacteriales bacterium]|nr:RluA family pseudouridine synthase [Eubacteriales bacterium]